MISYDFTPRLRSSAGFDRWSKLINELERHQTPNHPSYNIEKIDEQHYLVTLAVPGFTEDALTVETENQRLRIEGRQPEPTTNDHETQSQRIFVHQGFARNGFELRLPLADHVRVESAELNQGLLEIRLIQEVPEALKPQRIDIKRTDGLVAKQAKQKVLMQSEAK